MPDAPHKIAYELMSMDGNEVGWYPVGTFCLDFETAQRLYHQLKPAYATLAIQKKPITPPNG